ncbi:MAG TPA: NAD(P)-binding domain-containing protein, partial [Pseudomonadales bacterium]|nr:NAD(P)-binding domain-containing protein [Pseudomonadales bacterium]
MNIALIGLGNMGLPMAANLLKTGHHSVVGFDLVSSACDAHKANG